MTLVNPQSGLWLQLQLDPKCLQFQLHLPAGALRFPIKRCPELSSPTTKSPTFTNSNFSSCARWVVFVCQIEHLPTPTSPTTSKSRCIYLFQNQVVKLLVLDFEQQIPLWLDCEHVHLLWILQCPIQGDSVGFSLGAGPTRQAQPLL